MTKYLLKQCLLCVSVLLFSAALLMNMALFIHPAMISELGEWTKNLSDFANLLMLAIGIVLWSYSNLRLMFEKEALTDYVGLGLGVYLLALVFLDLLFDLPGFGWGDPYMEALRGLAFALVLSWMTMRQTWCYLRQPQP